MMAFSNVAIIGSTGLVGIELLSILEERPYPIGELRLFASERSAGKEQLFRRTAVAVEPMEKIDLSGVDVSFFMAGADVAREYMPVAKAAKCLTIDNSSAYRREPDVPLVVPEVNAHAIPGHEGLIANPNCTVIQLLVAIHPIHQISPVRRLVLSTYQSISGAGREDWDRLISETQGFLAGRPSGMAFNLWPGIDRLLDDGFYYEEEKVIEETRKILGNSEIAISATTVRVPVLRAHAVSVYLETEAPVELTVAERALEKAPGVEFIPKGGDIQSLSPFASAGRDAVRVGRLRKDRDSENGLLLWVVADNVRKGAALNAAQIAERAFEMA